MNIRVPVRLQVTVEFPPCTGHDNVHGSTRDIGFGGAFVETTGHVAEEGTLARLILDAGEENRLAVDAAVLRSEDGGIGLMFAYYGDCTFYSLAALLEPEFDRHLDVRSGPSRAGS